MFSKRIRAAALAAISCALLAAAAPAGAAAATYASDDGALEVSASGMARPTVLKKGAGFSLKGRLAANRKISEVAVTVRDLNRFKTDLRATVEPAGRKANLAGAVPARRFAALAPGEKQLDITVRGADGGQVVLKRRFTVLGKAAEPAHITGACSFSVTHGSARAVTDSSDATCWKYGTMTIKLPRGKVADGILVKWFDTWPVYTLVSYDGKGRVLDEYSSADKRMLHKYYALGDGARKVKIKLRYKANGKGMAALRVYEKGRVGVSVERWKAPKAGACDLMVVSSHCDDELLYMGGTIPYYQSVRGKNVYVMYMSGADRLRHREALAGQWALGNTTYPIFMDFPGGYHDGVSGTLRSWGGKDHVVGRVVEQIRKYKPKVIVTHALNGEYGHPTHKTTPRVVRLAIKAAADKTKYRASAKKYGTWKVKKLYLHMYPKNRIRMDYDEPAAALDWKTPYKAAVVAYDKHRSQHGGWSMNKSIVKRYPSNLYGLAYTRVGLDKKKDDFFEHVE